MINLQKIVEFKIDSVEKHWLSEQVEASFRQNKTFDVTNLQISQQFLGAFDYIMSENIPPSQKMSKLKELRQGLEQAYLTLFDLWF